MAVSLEKSYLYLKKILKENDTIVIGVSTGPDSMCLLSLLEKVKSEIPVNIIVAHVNHHVRKESAIEEKYIQEYCSNHQLICEIANLTPTKTNFEATAHQFRYNFFQKLILKYHANYLMTAHHGDDLIETVLMREIRGSSLKGYAGIALNEDHETFKLVRPLLFYTKDAILKYAEENKIKYFIDNTNFLDNHLRNRIRKNILPFLKRENPNVHLKYLQYSEELQAADKVLQNLTNETIKKVYNNNRLLIPAFLNQNQVIQERIIKLILKKIYKDDISIITNVQTKNIIALINRTNPNETLLLPHNFVAEKRYNELIFKKKAIKVVPLDNKSHQLKEINNYNNQIIKIVKTSNDISNFTTRLNSQELKMPLYIRTRTNGDKMSIKNMAGTKKVKDIFIDSKIPTEDRNSWLLVCDSNDNIIWLPGLKKSKFDKEINEKYDIILMFVKEGE